MQIMINQHVTAELLSLTDVIRGQASHVIEWLVQSEEATGYRPRHLEAGLFGHELGKGTGIIYCYPDAHTLQLLYAGPNAVNKDQNVMTQVRQRSTGEEMKPVTMQELNECLLNTNAAREAYDQAGRELAMLTTLTAIRERAGLSKAELARRLGIALSSLLRMEKNPLGISMKTLHRYATACGVEVKIEVVGKV
ncbi:helix-turn-helix domain-containing protein [Nissabacter sp. SGAir0207]|uniref:helix-turn-helix domain-containing protein n=1 Tax=Nissabacter sp. SGAir0207 TaxID=2126321 RepID=UPI00268BCFD2